MSKPRTNLTGQRFGKLSVVDKIVPPKGRTLFVCVCDCGKQVTLNGSDLQSGNTKSCGCLRVEKSKLSNLKHGATLNGKHTGAYRSWTTMKSRCYNEDNNRFYAYGGRGIAVCDRWLESFENFLADMGDRPDGCTIDRIDVNGNYDPENCRWATTSDQAKNQRKNVWYELDGQKMIQADVARALGVHPSVVLEMRRKNRLPLNLQGITA